MNVQVTARGDVSSAERELAREKVAALEHVVKGASVLGANVVLKQERNPRIPAPARAEGEIDLQGRLVRARAAGATMPAAIDELAERLHRQLRRHVDQLVTRNRVPATEPHGWRHGSWSPPRPPHVVRPAHEREIVRRKTFAIGPMTVAQAAAELDMLDHDFFLFADIDTGADAVLYRDDDRALRVIEPQGVDSGDRGPVPIREASRFSTPIDLAQALEEMAAVDHRYLFFVNADTRRGNVLYTRWDGHYGLIEPA